MRREQRVGTTRTTVLLLAIAMAPLLMEPLRVSAGELWSGFVSGALLIFQVTVLVLMIVARATGASPSGYRSAAPPPSH
jgi:hypothetical protein